MTIRIELEGDSVVNGDSLRGRAEWVSSGKEPRNIEVVCRWRIAGRANKLEQVIETKSEDNIAGRNQITIPFEFPISIAGPLSYEGKQFSIVWEIVATVDLPFAFDEEETKTFTVRPRPYDAEEFARLEDAEDGEEEDEGDDEQDDSLTPGNE
ncbi:MAG: hypothetical protein M3041_00590 [Acidobacteriota bacterium]|nr:hypothetical protein [Acidobacteriota bacterium]